MTYDNNDNQVAPSASAVQVLRHVEVPPPPLVARALSSEFFRDLKIEKPAPILFKDFYNSEFSGLCVPLEYTQEGEIEIDISYSSVGRIVKKERARSDLAFVYLHEFAHRLTGQGHNAVFATVNFALLLRAHCSMYQHIESMFSLYDFSDHEGADQAVGMIDAFSFIYDTGVRLAKSDLSDSKIAVEADRLWQLYQRQIVERPARQAAARATATAAAENLQQVLQARVYWFAAGIAVGMLAAGMIYRIVFA